ncbi:hypothetical protein M758_1G062300 [Ceratodon purpureus]|nr:hypothetical protein M758_1G062300 [Ceratodon purpureus]
MTMDMRRSVRQRGEERALKRETTSPLRRLVAGDCVMAGLVGSPLRDEPQGHHQVKMETIALEPTPLQIASGAAPTSKVDCVCTLCHKPKKVSNTSVKEEPIDVPANTMRIEPLVNMKHPRTVQAFRKKSKVQHATPDLEPPRTRSQTLHALRLENETLKEGYNSMNCCWRRILELHLPKAKYEEFMEKISKAL